MFSVKLFDASIKRWLGSRLWWITFMPTLTYAPWQAHLCPLWIMMPDALYISLYYHAWCLIHFSLLWIIIRPPCFILPCSLLLNFTLTLLFFFFGFCLIVVLIIYIVLVFIRLSDCSQAIFFYFVGLLIIFFMRFCLVVNYLSSVIFLYFFLIIHFSFWILLDCLLVIYIFWGRFCLVGN